MSYYLRGPARVPKANRTAENRNFHSKASGTAYKARAAILSSHYRSVNTVAALKKVKTQYLRWGAQGFRFLPRAAFLPKFTRFFFLILRDGRGRGRMFEGEVRYTFHWWNEK